MRGINCINNISLGKFELFCFMLAIVFIPFHVIHKFMLFLYLLYNFSLLLMGFWYFHIGVALTLINLKS